jgi:hypothetical protein
MVILLPDAVVAETVAGGLGRFDLSSCAKLFTLVNNVVATRDTIRIFFMLKQILVTKIKVNKLIV